MNNVLLKQTIAGLFAIVSFPILYFGGIKNIETLRNVRDDDVCFE